jgi:hypothetical protein
MVSTLSWLDHDASQQRTMERVLDALAERTAIDELGLGILRDQVSAVLHPGMSVLHTRARYLLFVPWAFQQGSGKTAETLAGSVRRNELQTMKALVARYGQSDVEGNGIIGRRTAEDPSRLPSGMYWSLLKRLGVLDYEHSIDSYFHVMAQGRRESVVRYLLHSEDDEPLGTFDPWRDVPAVPPGWPKEVDLDLLPDEAAYLRERILATDLVRSGGDPGKQSILAFLVDRDEWFADVDSVWDYPTAADFPAATARVMELGQMLDQLVHGARILYNFLCSRGASDEERADTYVVELSLWREEAAKTDVLEGWPSREFWTWVASVYPSSVESTRTFVEGWRSLVVSEGDLSQSSAAAAFIKRRETGLKGPLARLGNLDRLKDWSGAAGIGNFDYNWRVTRRILGDIHRGLGTQVIPIRSTGGAS